MKVVGIDKTKLFRNFLFQKSIVIFTGCQHLRRLFFLILTLSKKSKITKSALCPLLRWTVHPASSRLPVSEVKYSHGKYRGSNSGPTRVYALSCLYLYI
jgi:hypothetical protein